MTITLGRGKNRQQIQLPCASIIARADESVQAKGTHDLIQLTQNRGVRFAVNKTDSLAA